MNKCRKTLLALPHLQGRIIVFRLSIPDLKEFNCGNLRDKASQLNTFLRHPNTLPMLASSVRPPRSPPPSRPPPVSRQPLEQRRLTHSNASYTATLR
ncbi:hypothetical protein E2C01_097481 [Portunus trituberculatus]|uniref:Uncharacterized protein n=1 Tax=Portunus trituberculatus TaxID=210409 RepID=A0A5B7JVA8_PORTR|nr:hypothetical protein [Portunus trituberculatus]